MKRQGLLDMFNGINIIQTRYYIKIGCHTCVKKFCEKYLESWLCKLHITDDRPMPIPTDKEWLKKFNAAIGSSDPKQVAKLESTMQAKYCGGVGGLIWAISTCCPNIAYASIKLSQSNSAPAKHNFHGLKHTIWYLYSTRHRL